MTTDSKLKFYCKFCKKEIPILLEGDNLPIFNSKMEENELIEHAEYFHWSECHRRCCICGEILNSGEIDVFDITEKRIRIHPKYIQETKENEPEELLSVHEKCKLAKKL
jgi:hypothetical protein